MKVFMLVVLSLFSFASKAQNFRIEGKFIDNVASQKIYVRYNYGIDSATITNNSFIFERPFRGVEEVVLEFDPTSAFRIELPILPGENKLFIEPIRLNYRILNSELFSKYQELKQKTIPYRSKKMMIQWALSQKPKNRDSLQRLDRELPEQIDSFYQIISKEYSSSLLYPILLMNWFQINRESLALSEAVGDYVKNNPFHFAMVDLYQKVGTDILESSREAPNFTLKDVDGRSVSITDFKGKYVLIDFWASWCVPCREENPNVVSAYQKFKNRNFILLGVALESEGGRKAWLKAIKKDNLSWIQLTDFKNFASPVAKLYNVESIPSNFLISPQGKIIASELRGKRLHVLLDNVLPK